MVWQDVLIAVTNILFGYSLAYQVYRGFKEKKGFLSIQTSLITFAGLFALSIAYMTLNLFFSTVVCVFNGAMWALLFIQRIVYKKA